MQKQIAVFDLDPTSCSQMAEAVREYYNARGAPALVREFTAMQPFAYDFKDRQDAGEGYDMVFIGVDSMLGIETAYNIRQLDEWCPMFLCSEVADYAMEAFRLRALHYVLKPLSAKRVGEATGRIGMRCQAGVQWP